MRRLPIAAALLAMTGLGGCDAGAPAITDGCYYLGDTPVFSIAGGLGTMMIPGSMRVFRVERRSAGTVTFAPGPLFDGSGKSLHVVRDSGPATTYTLRRGAKAPTIEMHWAASGDSDVVLGKPCRPH